MDCDGAAKASIGFDLHEGEVCPPGCQPSRLRGVQHLCHPVLLHSWKKAKSLVRQAQAAKWDGSLQVASNQIQPSDDWPTESSFDEDCKSTGEHFLGEVVGRGDQLGKSDRGL